MPDLATLDIAIKTKAVEDGVKQLDGLTAAGGRAEKSTQGLASSMSNLTGIAQRLAAAFALYKLADFTREAVQAAARYDTLGVVMNVVGRNAGYTAAEMQKYADGVRKQGITMTESRDAVIKLAQAKIDLSKAEGLARIAQDAAVIGNTNSSDAFMRLIYGVQTAQTEVLRSIGINVSFEQSYAKLAQQLHKSTSALSEQEKMQARLNAVMASGDGIAGTYAASMGTVGKLMTSLQRFWDNLKVHIGHGAQGPLADFIDGLIKKIEELDQASQAPGFRDSMTNIAGAVSSIASMSMDAAVGGAKTLVGLLGEISSWFNSISSEDKAILLGLAAGGKFGGLYGAAAGGLAGWAAGSTSTRAIIGNAWFDRQPQTSEEARALADDAKSYLDAFGSDPASASILRVMDSSYARQEEAYQKWSALADILLKQENEAGQKAKESARDADRRAWGAQYLDESGYHKRKADEEKARQEAESKRQQAVKDRPQILAAQSALAGARADNRIYDLERAGETIAVALAQLDKAYMASVASHQAKLANPSISGGVASAVRQQMAEEEKLYQKKREWTLQSGKLEQAVEQDAVNLKIANLKGLETYDLEMKQARSQRDKSLSSDNYVERSNALQVYAATLQSINEKQEQANRQARGELATLNHDLNANLQTQIEELQVLREKTKEFDKQALYDKKIEGLQAHQKGDLWYAAKNSLAEYASSAQDKFANMTTFATNFASKTEDALVGAFMGAETAFSDFAEGVLSDLIRMQVRASVTGPLFNMLSGGSNGGLFSTIGSWFGFNHGGGMVGEPTFYGQVSPLAFAGAPRFHGGGWPGLASDEVPIIAQRGERVLSREEVAAGVGSGGSSVQIVIQNYTGAQVQTKETAGSGGQRQLQVVIGEVVKGAFDSGQMDNTMSKNYGLRRKGY
ncbi:Lambda phage tail tape-measure protein (Tape_meas_lam_C) [Humidesulfovibrio mexicanus]|uniref:Lambda phage tail tape-measure protein (Tape_meas_lam_C) n=1 Tax=Humidesulfovibrio mexicanus TaxID=147047 RepID=A0A239AXP3_9BACT|nr:phage tail tape measure C-terminal domain-containing protein [Humidesulfovibrio mexicanus]SNS00397.1 Lambda phage tail tape-measure protein (Tape_meas_lam_C) [Humidesulfovibrio mexicanus]